MTRFGIGIAALCLASLVAAPAQAERLSLASGSVLEAAQRLEPGEFFWAPQAAPEGPTLMMISRVTQRAVVYRNGVPIGITTVSTGRPGYETPTGVFTILQKNKDHRSNLYDDAPMPFMQRLTWSGVAIHAGNLPGHPASHGCIRLPYDFARELFAVTKLGGTVVITDEAVLPRVATNGPRLELKAGNPDSRDFTWNPSRSTNGPLSIVMSTADRRMIVLRNGVEIGSSPFSLVRKTSGTALYTLTAERRWLRVPLPGQPKAQAPASTEDYNRFTAPEAFRQALAEVVRPRTTVVVTSDSLKRTAPPTAEILIGEAHP